MEEEFRLPRAKPAARLETILTSTNGKDKSKKLVQIIHEPLKRIVIRELIRYDSAQQLVNAFTFLMKMGQPILLTWAEGIVFVTQPIPPPEMPDDYARGDLYVASVSYAPMPDYNQSIKVGSVEMGVIDLSKSPVSVELGKFLKAKLTG